MFPTDLQFLESTMTLVDTQEVREALVSLGTNRTLYPEAWRVGQVVEQQGFTLDTLQGGLYHLKPWVEEPTEMAQWEMRRLVEVLAPHIPSLGLDGHAPRIEWKAVEDDGRRYIWRVIAGKLYEHSEPIPAPNGYGYEYNLRYTYVCREHMHLTHQQARDLMSDPLNPTPADLMRAREATTHGSEPAIEETEEVVASTITAKRS